MVNFGNPYKDRRADSLIPENFRMQSPSSKKGLLDHSDGDPSTPPGSPPHDSYSATEGEGEAVFANPPSRIRKSPSRSDSDDSLSLPNARRQKTGHDESKISIKEVKSPAVQSSVGQKSSKAPGIPTSTPPPPRPPPKAPQANPTRIRPPGPPAPPPRAPPPPTTTALPRRASLPERPPAPPTSSNTKPPDPLRPLPQDLPDHSPVGTDSQAGAAAVPVMPPQTSMTPAGGGTTTGTSTPVADVVDMETAGKKPEVDLPPGWMTVWSKSQKRWYFFCTKTNKSVWAWPPPRETS